MKDFLRRTGYDIKCWLGSRYGMDALSLTLAGAGIILSLLFSILKIKAGSYIGSFLLILSVLRCYSSNFEKRRQELYRFNAFTSRFLSGFKAFRLGLFDRQHKYVMCPGCGRVYRLPKGRGTLDATCPGCGAKKRVRT